MSDESKKPKFERVVAQVCQSDTFALYCESEWL
ncbi:uncharacterized protein G2W53_028921 [Senna tora]|uniref:Uncharacterized protein n=1 Tax=Senna tora TaxID=362788 RepID=A0A834T6S0_9FABA|nr:uncharacterized protein G2W53_028921 [Senna tora]